MGAVERIFLGWDRPAVVSAAEVILSRFGADRPATEGRAFRAGMLDLSSVTIVAPGGRAQRLLLGALLDGARDRAAGLTPPVMLTPGRMVHSLRPPEGREASALVASLMWAKAAAGQRAAAIRALIPRGPGAEDLRGWMATSAILREASQALAGAGLRFEGVPAAAADFPGFDDAERWRAAARVQRAYEHALAEAGLYDAPLAQIDALRDGLPSGEADVGPLVLFATPELTAVAERAVRERAGPTLALVFAPLDMADRFDAVGRPLAERWKSAKVALRDEQIEFADDAEAQAGAALALLAASGAGAMDAVIGAPDAHVGAAMEAGSRWGGGPVVRSGAGTSLVNAAPVRLLRALAAHATSPSRATLGALVRHPDSAEALARLAGARDRAEAPRVIAGWIDRLDRFAQERGPGPLPSADEVAAARGDAGADPDDRLSLPEGLLRAAEELLGPDFLAVSDAPLGAHAAAIRNVLRSVYGVRHCDPEDAGDRLTIDACEAIEAALRDLEAMPTDAGPRCAVSDAMFVLADAVGAGASPAPYDANAIEALGWLELPFDPAPIAVITGLNEGVVPAGLDSGALLPDSLRGALGLECDESRFARDAHHFAAVCASRPVVRVFAGRRTGDGDPLRPSRLLFLCEPEGVVARMRRFVDPDGGDASEEAQGSGAPSEREGAARASPPRPSLKSSFLTAPIAGVRAIDSLPVTAFRDYLSSPYLFYLKHVIRREERDDAPAELDVMPFGSLLHRALAEFARGEAKDETREDRILSACTGSLERVVRRSFGDKLPPTVGLQALAAKHRIERFAAWQARRRALGWSIAHVEWPDAASLRALHERGAASINAEGAPLRLLGRIDRIDVHDKEGVAILDYKSGASAADPRKAHGGPGEWRDLQLPLYSVLAKEIIGDRALALGYVCLPRSGAVTDSRLEWDDIGLGDAIADAVGAARAIVAEARTGARLGEVGPRHPDRGAFGALAGKGLLTRESATSEALGGAEAEGEFDTGTTGDDE